MDADDQLRGIMRGYRCPIVTSKLPQHKSRCMNLCTRRLYFRTVQTAVGHSNWPCGQARNTTSFDLRLIVCCTCFRGLTANIVARVIQYMSSSETRFYFARRRFCLVGGRKQFMGPFFSLPGPVGGVLAQRLCTFPE